MIDHIRDARIRSEFGVGDSLPLEADLAENFAVGVTTISKAIKMLEAVGVVKVRQGRDTMVRDEPLEDPLSPKSFQLIVDQGTNQELVELRRLLEPKYMHLAMERA